MSFLTIDGLTVHYKLNGLRNGPLLVFVNSLGCDLRIWDDVVPHLAGRFSILRYDKRGHGLTDCPPGPYAIRDFSSDLTGLLDALEFEKIILVGISVGGMVAIDFVHQHPDRVAALVLSDTGLKIGSADMWHQRVAAVRAQGMQPLTATILERWFAPDFASREPASHRGWYNMLARMPVEGYTATCEALADADLHSVADTITIPTLALCGAQDSATLPDLVQALAGALPQARYTEIEGAGHLPCIEQPAAMARIMKDFFEEQGYV